jgi:hypothetical protein
VGGEGGPYHMDSGQTYKIAGLFCGGKGGERLCFCFSHPTTPLIELRLRGHINALGLIQVARRIIILFSAQTNGEMDGPDFSIRS